MTIDATLDTAAALFAGPGEMRARCRTHDWSATSLGSVDGWPQSLRTAAAYTLASGFAAILLWGPELAQIYNDAYVPFLGDKHPWALGQPTHECWPEIRDVTGPAFERALAGETVTLHEQPFDLRRRGPGAPADRMYITLSYVPVRDEQGQVGGVLATAMGADEAVTARRIGQERETLASAARLEGERLRSLIVHMPAPVALLVGPEHRHEIVNDEFRRISGGGRDVTGLTVREAFPELAGQGIYETLDRVYASGEPWAAPGSLVRYDRDGTGVRDAWFDVRFVPVRDATGAVIGILNFAVDVTTQVTARMAVERSAAAARRALDGLAATYRTAPVGLAVVDRDLRFVRINERLAEINGASVEAHVGRTVREMIPRVADVAESRLLEVMSTGVPRYDVPISVQMPNEGGEVRHWLEHWLPLRDAAGTVMGVNIVAEEVTERMRADVERERLLAAEQAARERSEAVLASIADAFYLLDRDWRFMYVNDAAEPLLQTTREALLGRTLWEMFPGVTGSEFEGPYRTAMATGQATSVESYFPPLGTWFDVHSYPWAGGLMVHFRDVGARKAAEAERERLLAAEQSARAAVERAAERTARLQRVTAALAVAVTTEDVAQAMLDVGLSAVGAVAGVVCRLDDTASAIDRVWALGYPMDGLDWFREHALTVALPPRDVVRTRQPVWIENEAAWLARYLMPNEGMTAPPAAAALPLLVGDRLVGVMVLRMPTPHRFPAEDRTQLLSVASQCAQALERTRLYEAERDARAHADEANRAKSEFLAVMSHELRTPLNAIGGYAELIELGIHGPVTAEQRTALARIQKSQRHLLGLINGVLNYARVEAGAVHYEIGDVPLDEVLSTCEALTAPQVRAKGLTMRHEGCDTDLRVRADRDKVQQVVLNLISNAVKFTEPGGALELACTADGNMVRVRVTDTGRGIALDQLERVFEPFVQVDARLTRTQEGTGLGLAISRDLARGMGGELTAASTLRVGSVFTLVLPKGEAVDSR